MPNVSDFRAIVQGVEQAEARGDHATAERLLRQALALQEASLGPNHPEVANILNNLAIVCEINGKLTDAETSYRRAYAIATSRYPANDPFVTTSRENLEQFCTARGIPFKRMPPAVAAANGPVAAPTPAASAAPPRPAPPTPKAAPPEPKAAPLAPKAAVPPPSRAAAPPSLDDFDLRMSPAAPTTLRTLSAQAATREPSRTPVIAAVIAVLVIVLAGAWYLTRPNRAPERTASAPAPSSSAAPPLASPPATAEPVREPEPAPAAPAATASAAPPPAPAPAPVAPTPTPVPTTPAAVAPEPPAATARTSGVDVVSAELCRTLTTSGAWKCAPATGTVAPGPMVFYTRVASGRDATIEHRWYRGNQLHQRVPLRIRANPSGFRTYSRTTITTGSWKVEITTQDGKVLDEKTFVVQQ